MFRDCLKCRTISRLVLASDPEPRTNPNLTMKQLDFKSVLIGFLLATTLWLAMGNRDATLDVRIVGIDKHFADWDPIKVELSK